ncbi:MAG: undecaprenyl-diphosphate phosphatase [Spirochaetaceae bacterium]|nr:undecaprenyl-diphosphate phosphatase [Spirochaetaceae bacterium]
MSIFEAIILGAVQGLTEFLPVSSSGHLVLLQKIFRISEPVLFFDTMLHLGTLVAVFAVLRQDIWKLLCKPIQRLTGLLILATIPTVIIALLFKDAIEEAFTSGAYLGFAFLGTAAVLIVSDRLSRNSMKTKNEYTMNWTNALVIGILQAIAIIPGVSRSGSTLSGAFACKLNRDFGARFSFLLAIPAILGALVFQIKDLFQADSGVAIDPMPYAAGTLTAGIVGFFSVKLMLTLVREHGLWGFGLYVAVLGILVLTDQYLIHCFF